MHRSLVEEYFRERKWGASALILLIVTMVAFLVSVQIFGALHIPVYYAARANAPQWSIRWMQTIGYIILASTIIDIVGLVVDRRKVMAWLVLVGCILSFAALGAAFE